MRYCCCEPVAVILGPMEPLRCRLVYDGAQLAEPILFRIGRDESVKVAVLSETICARRGTLSVSLSGERLDVEGAVAHLRSAGIGVEVQTDS